MSNKIEIINMYDPAESDPTPGQIAGYTNRGMASFDANDFDVVSGKVSLKYDYGKRAYNLKRISSPLSVYTLDIPSADVRFKIASGYCYNFVFDDTNAGHVRLSLFDNTYSVYDSKGNELPAGVLEAGAVYTLICLTDVDTDVLRFFVSGMLVGPPGAPGADGADGERGETGARGNGIIAINQGESYESDRDTITPITIVTNDLTKELTIRAENGSNGRSGVIQGIGKQVTEPIEDGSSIKANYLYFTKSFGANIVTLLPDELLLIVEEDISQGDSIIGNIYQVTYDQGIPINTRINMSWLKLLGSIRGKKGETGYITSGAINAVCECTRRLTDYTEIIRINKTDIFNTDKKLFSDNVLLVTSDSTSSKFVIGDIIQYFGSTISEFNEYGEADIDVTYFVKMGNIRGAVGPKGDTGQDGVSISSITVVGHKAGTGENVGYTETMLKAHMTDNTDKDFSAFAKDGTGGSANLYMHTLTINKQQYGNTLYNVAINFISENNTPVTNYESLRTALQIPGLSNFTYAASGMITNDNGSACIAILLYMAPNTVPRIQYFDGEGMADMELENSNYVNYIDNVKPIAEIN